MLSWTSQIPVEPNFNVMPSDLVGVFQILCSRQIPEALLNSLEMKHFRGYVWDDDVANKMISRWHVQYGVSSADPRPALAATGLTLTLVLELHGTVWMLNKPPSSQPV